MLNVNIGSQPIEIKAVNYSDFLDKLSEYGCTNADIHTTSLPADKKLKGTDSFPVYVAKYQVV